MFVLQRKKIQVDIDGVVYSGPVPSASQMVEIGNRLSLSDNKSDEQARVVIEKMIADLFPGITKKVLATVTDSELPDLMQGILGEIFVAMGNDPADFQKAVQEAMKKAPQTAKVKRSKKA